MFWSNSLYIKKVLYDIFYEKVVKWCFTIIERVSGMKKEDIEKILQSCSEVEKENKEYAIPTKEEWMKLEKQVQYVFPDEFKAFIDLMSVYLFPGDIFNATEHNNNGNDTILYVYQYESRYQEWDSHMIPFMGIGNGDYFCISKLDSKIYYFYCDKLMFEVYSQSMSDWIKELPDFLE